MWAYAVMVAGLAGAADAHVPVKWPLDWCAPARLQKASPAPMPNDSTALRDIPFSMSLLPWTASVLIRLTPDRRAIIECLVDEGDYTGFEPVAAEALADVVFSAPLAVNTAEAGGLYIARVSSYWGVSWVEPPPSLPILPACPALAWPFMPRWALPPKAPKPASRVPPVFPDAALYPGIEGEVVVVLDIFSDGTPIPKCLARSTPPGWFESASVSALSQWRFEPGTARGVYTVTVKFRME